MMMMQQKRSNSYSKVNCAVKRDAFTFSILNPDKKLNDNCTQIIVKTSDDEVHFLGINQQFSFNSENKLQIQVVIKNKMFGSISFRPQTINKIPNSSSAKWITLFNPIDDFYDGDFNDDDLEEPKVFIQFHRVNKVLDDKSNAISHNQMDNIVTKQTSQTDKLIMQRDVNAEQRMLDNSNNQQQHNRLKNSSNNSSQQNLKNVFKQSFNMKLINEDLNGQIQNKEECLKKMGEKVERYKIKCDVKEKENEVLSHNIQKVQLQCNELSSQVLQEQTKNSQQLKLINKAETKIQKLTDYLIDLKENHKEILLENSQLKQKIKDQEEKQISAENIEYFQDQLEKKKIIIDNLRQQIQEYKEMENKKEDEISQLKEQLKDQQQKIHEIEQKQIQFISELDSEKTQKIESLLNEVNSQKQQGESLSEQIKIFLKDQTNLRKQIDEKEQIILEKESKEIDLTKQLEQQKQEVEDQTIQIEEQSQHIKNQAKQINEQNYKLLKYKQMMESLIEKQQKEAECRNQLSSDCKTKQIQLQNDNFTNQKIQTNTQEQQSKSTHNLLTEQFWQKIPNKIADLEKVIAEYDQKHLILNEQQQQQIISINHPVIGVVGQQQHQQKEKQFTSTQYANYSPHTTSVTPFMQPIENSNLKEQQTKNMNNKQQTNFPIQLSNYHQHIQQKGNQALSSPFSTLSFTNDNLMVVEDEYTNVNKVGEDGSILNQVQLLKRQEKITVQQTDSIQRQSQSQEKENSSSQGEKEVEDENEVQINEYRNKRYQLRISQPIFASNQSTTKSNDFPGKLGTISIQVNSSSNSEATSPIFRLNTQQSTNNSALKTKRSSSITHLSDQKRNNVISQSLSSSQKKRNSTSIEQKRWKL